MSFHIMIQNLHTNCEEPEKTFNVSEKINESKPLNNMIDEMLFEHNAPAFDRRQQICTEQPCVDFEPVVEYDRKFDVFDLFVEHLVHVNLTGQRLLMLLLF